MLFINVGANVYIALRSSSYSKLGIPLIFPLYTYTKNLNAVYHYGVSFYINYFKYYNQLNAWSEYNLSSDKKYITLLIALRQYIF